MKKIFIIGIVILILIVLFLSIFLKKKKPQCEDITGGRYFISFHTDCDLKIQDISVGIGVSPDTYEELPIPSREGYYFAGWYYDENFEKEVGTVNTMYITPSPLKNKDGCIIGYEDITLYAKWEKK